MDCSSEGRGVVETECSGGNRLRRHLGEDLFGAANRSIGDGDSGRGLLLVEGDDGLDNSSTEVTGTDEQDRPTCEGSSEFTGCHRHRRAGERRCSTSDGGLGADPLTGVDGGSEELIEDRACDVVLHGPLMGSADLTEDFGFAGNARFQSRSDGEEVARHVVVVGDGERRAERTRGETSTLGQDLGDLCHRIVEALNDGVDLGSQAGRDDHHFTNVGVAPEVGDDLVEVVVGDRHLLEHLERSVAVVESYDDDRHLFLLARLLEDASSTPVRYRAASTLNASSVDPSSSARSRCRHCQPTFHPFDAPQRFGRSRVLGAQWRDPRSEW